MSDKSSKVGACILKQRYSVQNSVIPIAPKIRMFDLRRDFKAIGTVVKRKDKTRQDKICFIFVL